MRPARFSEEQIIGVPKEAEAGAQTADRGLRHRVAAHTAAIMQRATLAALRRSLALEFLFGIAAMSLVALLGTMSPTGTAV